ncbi:hypothetical protein MY5147_005497 [Beauveria neobassiana]
MRIRTIPIYRRGCWELARTFDWVSYFNIRSMQNELTSGVADDADGKAGGQSTKTDSKAAAKLQKGSVESHLLVEAGYHDDTAN